MSVSTMTGGWKRRFVAMGLGGVALATVAGCQADYAADIINRSSDPVFVQLVTRAHGAGEKSVVAANKRLGPGDRSFIGPVRASDRAGSVFVSIDSLPESSRPFTMDLPPGVTFLEAGKNDDGGVQVQVKR
jgi:hypothetical protein